MNKAALKRMTRRTEFYMFIVLILLCGLVQFKSGGKLFMLPGVFTRLNVTVLRTMVVDGMFAMCSLVVMISGGFDLSFPAIAALAYSLSTTICLNNGWCATNPLAGFALADGLRATTAEAIEDLNKLGVRTVMLTGDNERTAQAIGGRIGVTEVRAELLPEDKQTVIADLQGQGRKVMMVGDGINDAPALVKADLGTAVGQGTDVAIESADVVLMRDDPRLAAGVIRLGRAGIRNIRQNLFWAFFYNSIGIPIAAGVLAPLGVELSPMLAAAAMSMSSVCVVTNALRLRRFRLPYHEDTAPVPAAAPVNDIIKEEETMSKTVKIEGMMCQMCVKHVKKALEALDPAVEVSLENKCATLKADADDAAIKAAVADAGYEVVGIE